MADRPYRAAKQGGCLFVGVVLAVIAGSIGLATLIDANRNPILVFAAVGVPILLVIIGSAILFHRADKKRIEGISQGLQAAGWTVFVGPTHEQLPEFFGPFAFMIQWGGLTERGSIKWAAHREGEFLYEHNWVTGSGKTTQEHHRTTWVGLLNHSFNELYMVRPLFGERRRIRDKIVPTGDPQFDRHWAATGPVPQDLRDIMGSPPKGEAWSFGSGCLACITRIPLDAENILKFAERAKSIAQAAGALSPS